MAEALRHSPPVSPVVPVVANVSAGKASDPQAATYQGNTLGAGNYVLYWAWSGFFDATDITIGALTGTTAATLSAFNLSRCLKDSPREFRKTEQASGR